MPTRNSNITLNLTDDDEPAVQQRHTNGSDTAPAGDSDDDHSDEAIEITNDDGSVTVYGTPEPTGKTTTENVPGSPLAAEIRAFEEEIDHPEAFSDIERQAVAIHRHRPDLSHGDISDRLEIARTTVSKACRKARLAALSDSEEIHAAFHRRTDAQQAIITASVRTPDRLPGALADLTGYSRTRVSTAQNNFGPLIRHLTEVGLPDDAQTTLDQPPQDDLASADEAAEALADSAPDATDESDETVSYVCPTCGETFDSVNARNGHTAVHTQESDTDDAIAPHEPADEDEHTHEVDTDGTTAPAEQTPLVAREDLTTIRQTVERLHEAAATEQELCDSLVSQASTAARQATCNVILARIDAVLTE
jgi:uncharacterized Zn finger protein (UPF0148 family)/transposase-like protein